MVEREGRVEGRTAVVTGGCSGIGLATVRRLADEGAHVVVGDLDEQRGPEVAAEVGGLFVRADVTSPDDVDVGEKPSKSFVYLSSP